ncbi:tRNA glutamyl-Q(34) synthetase GluQRS [Roseobacter denitrificans]|uniref:Glutamyl-tRNA synthetase, putative n=1 Tax=Roseobacter denitrificans (strain ATCC 33942 / OCh 114) TaxID=375451 RepID=Q166D5_ROSDO|nr:tRNA glutamyl-Q(34) synthetase GluQRS [Roseobacter denitrificans]ABG32158.1 glutamyl-tRNA synthetase, putative [Roseobacter denitrificans OCh 114]AVL51663.1 tRNA glutamyl-Q(34) synthetase GluQRS [Roseobacter denitrificans]SFF78101.1 glutamyl-Q tRNA(Asp) synthetase [Roseobacter denitrificans OCh 114]
MTFTTRFAPSPTGPLHLGHAYSALLAWDMAAAAGGAFLLRIEDIDQSRARPTWEAQIYKDLAWLGLRWPEPVMRQSDRFDVYRAALTRLERLGVTYPCTCSRKDIQLAASAPQEGSTPVFGPDGLVYPGTCRAGSQAVSGPPAPAIRLNMAKALDLIADSPLTYQETGSGTHKVVSIEPATALTRIGDIVLARRDMGTSYHLSVVVDDSAQNVSTVVRGADLAEATQIHVILQRLLDVPTPDYYHHRLIRDDAGKRLAKRDDARALAKFRDEGCAPQDIRAMVGLAV